MQFLTSWLCNIEVTVTISIKFVGIYVLKVKVLFTSTLKRLYLRKCKGFTLTLTLLYRKYYCFVVFLFQIWRKNSFIKMFFSISIKLFTIVFAVDIQYFQFFSIPKNSGINNKYAVLCKNIRYYIKMRHNSFPLNNNEIPVKDDWSKHNHAKLFA